MKKAFVRTGLTLALLLAVVAAVPAEAGRAGDRGGSAAGLPTIAEIALGSDDFDSLVTAVDRAGLVPTLLDPEAGPFTVFAPTDDAFDMLLQETGIDVATVDVGALTDVLNDHIVPGALKEAFLKRQSMRGNRITTAGGLTLGFNRTPFQVNGINIVISQVMASNGIIYAIDRVLLDPAPSITDVAIANSEVLSTLVDAVVATGLAGTLDEDGPFTVFAPVNAAFEGVDLGALTEDQIRDILLDHVVDGNYTRTELFMLAISRSTLVTKGGLELEFRGARVNGNRILVSNISAGNGTIFLIDGILLED
jgi:transforming growth factor-beta-induced protein